MDNVQILRNLRDTAIRRGFPRDRDKRYYVAERKRLRDERSYIADNTDHAILFEPDWLSYLVGADSAEEGLPYYEYVMVQMAHTRAQKGNVIGYLNQVVQGLEKQDPKRRYGPLPTSETEDRADNSRTTSPPLSRNL